VLLSGHSIENDISEISQTNRETSSIEQLDVNPTDLLLGKTTTQIEVDPQESELRVPSDDSSSGDAIGSDHSLEMPKDVDNEEADEEE
jgi:hypothetical protein